MSPQTPLMTRLSSAVNGIGRQVSMAISPRRVVRAPTALQVTQGVDHRFRVLKKSGRTDEEVLEEAATGVDGWFQKVLEI